MSKLGFSVILSIFAYFECLRFLETKEFLNGDAFPVDNLVKLSDVANEAESELDDSDQAYLKTRLISHPRKQTTCLGIGVDD